MALTPEQIRERGKIMALFTPLAFPAGLMIAHWAGCQTWGECLFGGMASVVMWGGGALLLIARREKADGDIDRGALVVHALALIAALFRSDD